MKTLVTSAQFDEELPGSGEALEITAGPLDLAQLFRLHHLTVARWAERLGGPEVEVADVVQDVFLVVKRRLPTFSPRAKVTTWLFKITENVARDHRRRLRLRRLLRWRAQAVARVQPAVPQPFQAAEAGQARARVYAVLDRLRERDRTLLILFEMEGLSGEEVAERLGVKLPALWVGLHRARQRFLVELGKIEGQEAALG